MPLLKKVRSCIKTTECRPDNQASISFLVFLYICVSLSITQSESVQHNAIYRSATVEKDRSIKNKAEWRRGNTGSSSKNAVDERKEERRLISQAQYGRIPKHHVWAEQKRSYRNRTLMAGKKNNVPKTRTVRAGKQVGGGGGMVLGLT